MSSMQTSGLFGNEEELQHSFSPVTQAEEELSETESVSNLNPEQDLNPIHNVDVHVPGNISPTGTESSSVDHDNEETDTETHSVVVENAHDDAASHNSAAQDETMHDTEDEQTLISLIQSINNPELHETHQELKKAFVHRILAATSALEHDETTTYLEYVFKKAAEENFSHFQLAVIGITPSVPFNENDEHADKINVIENVLQSVLRSEQLLASYYKLCHLYKNIMQIPSDTPEYAELEANILETLKSFDQAEAEYPLATYGYTAISIYTNLLEEIVEIYFELLLSDYRNSFVDFVTADPEDKAILNSWIESTPFDEPRHSLQHEVFNLFLAQLRENPEKPQLNCLDDVMVGMAQNIIANSKLEARATSNSVVKGSPILTGHKRQASNIKPLLSLVTNDGDVSDDEEVLIGAPQRSKSEPPSSPKF